MKKLLLFLLCVAPVHARMGESFEQCNKRYGTLVEKSISETDGSFAWVSGGISTECFFSSGKCVSISFGLRGVTRVMTNSDDDKSRFSEAQMGKLLSVAVPGAKWVKAEDSDILTVYKTEAGDFIASTLKVSSAPTLEIQSVADIEARKARLKPEAIDKTVESFK